MRYAPRDRSRVPLVRRLRDSINGLLLEATQAQTTGEIYSPSSMVHELIESIDVLTKEDEAKTLEPHQRDFLNIGTQLANFVVKLEGIRLRVVSDKEILELNEHEEVFFPRKRKLVPAISETAQNELQCVRNRATPTILKRITPRVRCSAETKSAVIVRTQSSGASTSFTGFNALDYPELTEVKEEEEYLVKEENLCEVDSTPMSFETTTEPGTTADCTEEIPELKKEIKEEEPDDIPLRAPQLADNDSYMGSTHGYSWRANPSLLREELRRVARRDGAPLEPNKADRFDEFKTPIRRTPAELNPSIPFLNATSNQKIMQIPPKMHFAPGAPEPPKKRLIKIHPPLLIDKDGPSTSDSPSSSGQIFNGRRIVMCRVCEEPVEERELNEHMREYHARVQQKVVLIPPHAKKITFPCDDLACDFEGVNMRDTYYHKEKRHGAVYKEWQIKGRFTLVPGTYCPYCTQTISHLAQLRKHLQWMHPDRMASQMNIFSCSVCCSRFGRLHEVYEHWHISKCLGGIRIAQNLKIHAGPSRTMIASASDVITGPRGKTGF